MNKKFDGGGVFTFRNSWGSGWGENGYGKISVALARKLIIEIYAVQPIKQPVKPAVEPKSKPVKTAA